MTVVYLRAVFFCCVDVLQAFIEGSAELLEELFCFWLVGFGLFLGLV